MRSYKLGKQHMMGSAALHVGAIMHCCCCELCRGRIHRWQASQPKPRCPYGTDEFVAHTGAITCLKIGRKSSGVLVTGGQDKKVNVWAIGKPTAILVRSSRVLRPSSDAASGMHVCIPAW